MESDPNVIDDGVPARRLRKNSGISSGKASSHHGLAKVKGKGVICYRFLATWSQRRQH